MDGATQVAVNFPKGKLRMCIHTVVVMLLFVKMSTSLRTNEFVRICGDAGISQNRHSLSLVVRLSESYIHYKDDCCLNFLKGWVMFGFIRMSGLFFLCSRMSELLLVSMWMSEKKLLYIAQIPC